MKSIKTIVSAMIPAFLFIALFSACNVSTPTGNIVGTWQSSYYIITYDGDVYREDNDGNMLVFYEDNTGTTYEKVHPELADDFTWSLQGKELTLIYNDGTSGEGSHGSDTFLTESKMLNELVLVKSEGEDQIKFYFNRIK